jgi:hypothetical protein
VKKEGVQTEEAYMGAEVLADVGKVCGSGAGEFQALHLSLEILDAVEHQNVVLEGGVHLLPKRRGDLAA